MKRTVYSVVYWVAAILIALGAFGHGIGGARNLQRAFAAATNFDPHAASIIWVVWYWVSGTMLFFGGISLWAWFPARRGNRDVLVLPLGVAAFYMITGILTVAVEHEAFWLLFLIEGALLLVGTLGLRGATSPSQT